MHLKGPDQLPLTMLSWKNKLLNRFSANPKTLFLIDSAGGFISAIMLGLVLARFESIFGMPNKVLYSLAIIAFLFFIYSFLCFLVEVKNWRPYMKIVAIMNFLYCCLTIALIIFLYQKISVFGLIYFFVEIVIVSILAVVELKVASNYLIVQNKVI